MSLADLLASPSSVEATLQAARTIRDAYVNEYRIHHRDYFKSIEGLREKLKDIQRQAVVLTQLNKLRCAGPPLIPNVATRVATLEGRLKVCPHSKKADVAVSPNLRCQDEGCDLLGLDPLAEPPLADVDALSRDLTEAIRQRINAVKAKAILAILEQSAEPGIGTFLAILQAGQFDGLLDVLDDRLVMLVDDLLERARVTVVPTGALAKVAQRFGTIQRSQITDVAEALRAELELAFAVEEKGHPGKTVQLQLSLGD